MNILPHKDRELLGGLRICRPRERDQTASRNMMIVRPRVLVPEGLLPWINDMQAHGGIIHQIDLRYEVCAIARDKIGALYDLKADPEQGPDRYSCSSFTKAVFARIGIWLPRYSVDQSHVGTPIAAASTQPGDLLFFRNRFPIHDPDRSIGHVGIKVDDRHMIHGSSRKRIIARECIPATKTLCVNVLPHERSVLLLLPERMTGMETALDVVRWLQR